MKFQIILLTTLVFTIFSSCEKSNLSPLLRQYVGNYDAEIDGGFSQVDCKMEISPNGNNLEIRVHDNGNEIDPDIFVNIEDDGNGNLIAIPCSDSCYQGDANITSGTLTTRSNGKIRLQFYVRPIGSGLGSIQLTVTEI